MPDSSILIKPSSGMCNMHCEYCFYCDESRKRTQESYGFMSEDTLRQVIRRTMIHADRQVSYAYQGGEPALRGLDFFKKAAEFQRKYNRRGMGFRPMEGFWTENGAGSLRRNIFW